MSEPDHFDLHMIHIANEMVDYLRWWIDHTKVADNTPPTHPSAIEAEYRRIDVMARRFAGRATTYAQDKASRERTGQGQGTGLQPATNRGPAP